MRSVDPGFLLGDRRLGLWSIAEPGRRALRGGGEPADEEQPWRARRNPRGGDRQVPLRIASYRLLAWYLAETREHGRAVALRGWEWPWVREYREAGQQKGTTVRLPAAADIAPLGDHECGVMSSRRILLLPDLGTAPVTRYRELVRRVVVHNELVTCRTREPDELLIGSPDPDGAGTRIEAWHELFERVARRQDVERMPVRVVSWARVEASLGGSATSALVARERRVPRSMPIVQSGREQVLHLLGRHPLLTVGQLARLLGTTRRRIKRFERELTELGLARLVDSGDLRSVGLDLASNEFAQLGLVELTGAGRRALAEKLGLGAATAGRHHGLTGSGRADGSRRQRWLRTLAHTVGVNDVFVAFALAAAAARRRGRTDELAQWRGAAACERRRCKPDGYGLYVRDGVDYGFLLEFDRGTESARRYGAKFRAYYRYRDSGQAARDYQGMPTILFVTTSIRAEDRIAEQAFRAWLSHGTEPLRVRLTTTDRISEDADGVLGPIWRTPGEAAEDVMRRGYWPPARVSEPSTHGRRATMGAGSFMWTAVAGVRVGSEPAASKRSSPVRGGRAHIRKPSEDLALGEEILSNTQRQGTP